MAAHRNSRRLIPLATVLCLMVAAAVGGYAVAGQPRSTGSEPGRGIEHIRSQHDRLRLPGSRKAHPRLRSHRPAVPGQLDRGPVGSPVRPGSSPKHAVPDIVII